MPVLAPLLVIIFLAILFTILIALGLIRAFVQSKQNNQIRAMLRTADPVIAERSVEILRPKTLENSLEQFLANVGVADRLGLILEQAGTQWTCTKLVMFCALAAMVGFVLSLQAPRSAYSVFLSLLLPLFCGYIPVAVVLRKRKKRIRAFEEQFPEALDFLSRSMRAGHAFSVGLEMLVTDSPEPLASIFRRSLGELHLGSPLSVALGKIIQLVPLVDVRFFVSSVMLQQETGGNLSEILNKLSQVIRERFRVKGQVKAAAAHGKITGLVLTVMPIVVALFMMVLSPAYIMVLFTNHTGKMLVCGAAVGQLLGYLCIRKITNIKV